MTLIFSSDYVLLNLFKKWFNFGEKFIKQSLQENLHYLVLQPLDIFLDFEQFFPKTLNFLENFNSSFKIKEYLQIWHQIDNSKFWNHDLMDLVIFFILLIFFS